MAMGVLVTYASYLPRAEQLPGAAITMPAGDTMFAIVAGVMIVPAVFTYGVDPVQGPVLVA